MHKCFLAAVIFFSLLSLKLFAQFTPLDRCLQDSMFRMMRHETPVQKAVIYLELGEMLQNTQPEKSFSYYISAFKISISEKNDTLKAKARMQIGDYFTMKRKFMQGHEQYLAAWKTYQRIMDTTGQMRAIIKIGIVNRTLKNFPKALSYLKRGMALAQKTNKKSMNGLLFDQLAVTYQAMGNHMAAMYFYNRAIGFFRQAGDRMNEDQVKNDIGTLYLNEDKYPEALAFYTKLLSETDSSNKDLRGVLYTRIGHIHSKMGDYRTSLHYNMKALAVRQRNRATPEVNSSLINVAGDYYDLERPDSGKIFMDSGLILANRYDRKNLIENGYRHLYNYYLHRKNYKRALDCYARYSSVAEVIIREQNRNNIAILETNQQLQRIQQSGKVKEREHDFKALNVIYHDYQIYILAVLVIVAGLSMLIFVILLLYIRRVRRKMQDLNIQLSEEIREREAMEEQTRDRENQYKFITDNSIDFITHMDSERNRIYASPASMSVYGYEADEIINKSPYDLTHPDFYEYAESKFREMIEHRASRQFVYQARKKDGTVFWVESILNPLFDPISGVFKGMVGVTRDIQERKTKEFEIMEGTKQKENLLKEIHHRVKNNFAILVSLINMQMAQTKNQELLQSLTNLQLRIRTMSLVHEMLYRSNDFEKISFPGYLRSLASVIAGTYNRRDIDLSVEADEVVMDIEASIPLGLIINEILSNAYKHAFPDGRPGKIQIRFTVDDQSGINTLVLSDDGIGMPKGVNLEQITTMGLQVVQILCNQIEAKLVVTGDPGTSFAITFQPAEK
ncbi:MAG: PAS domain S-box protein [Bacteroidetes bacterium]|nr:PAS domain S-box protein [Bacteroidota bacterium]